MNFNWIAGIVSGTQVLPTGNFLFVIKNSELGYVPFEILKDEPGRDHMINTVNKAMGKVVAVKFIGIKPRRVLYVQ